MTFELFYSIKWYKNNDQRYNTPIFYVTILPVHNITAKIRATIQQDILLLKSVRNITRIERETNTLDVSGWTSTNRTFENIKSSNSEPYMIPGKLASHFDRNKEIELIPISQVGQASMENGIKIVKNLNYVYERKKNINSARHL